MTTIQNKLDKSLVVYVEPSTDELTLHSGDVLKISLKGSALAEGIRLEACDGYCVVWIEKNQSADFFINGVEVDTICSRCIW